MKDEMAASGRLQTLIADLTSVDAARVTTAAEALAHLGAAAQTAAVALVRACGMKDESARTWAVAALEGMGPPAPEQIDSLIELAQHPTGDVAYWAITLLGRAGAIAAPAVDVLGKILGKSPQLPIRERAAWALGQIGPAASAALPQLREVATDGPPRLARLAHAAIAAIAG